MSRTSRGKWLRCPACAELPHWLERCLGRDAGCCRFCPGRWEAILADALKTVMQQLLRERLDTSAVHLDRCCFRGL